MKSFLFLAALLALGAVPARADSIRATATAASMYMMPNTGLGEHIFFKFTGPGVDVEGDAGMACFDWCTGAPIPPGTDVGTGQIYFDGFQKLVLGGITYDGYYSSIFGEFNDRGGLNASATGYASDNVDRNDEYVLFLPTNGRWVLNFDDAVDLDGNQTKAFVDGTFTASATPEPAPLGLTLLGAAGIWITSRRRAGQIV
jgi:hypothetical protein